jgi:hypothetical protein
MFFSGDYWYKNVTFKITLPGQYLICAFAMDTSNLTGNNFCYSVVYGIAAPTIIKSSYFPLGATFIDPSTPFYFSCNFSQVVKRPSTSSYIRLIDASTNKVVATLDSNSSSNVIIANNRLRFSFGSLPQPNKTYYINLDLGKIYFRLKI